MEREKKGRFKRPFILRVRQELVNVETIVECNDYRLCNAVDHFRLEFDLPSRSDRLLGQTIRKPRNRRDAAYSTRRKERDLQSNASLNIVCSGRVGIRRLRLRNDLKRSRHNSNLGRLTNLR